MEQTEKKVYPSQLNSKALACRVPMGDYVKFLNEAISKGITLNDWLLMKVYSDNASISGMNNEEFDEETDVIITITKNELLEDNEYVNEVNFWLRNSTWFENNKIELSKEELKELLTSYANLYVQNYKFFNAKKEASLSDVKNQLTVLIKNKFSMYSDQKEYRKELFDLLKELE